jgi:hypothetical protein
LNKRTVEIDGEKVELVYFRNPMSHEDWHEAEEMGLEYSHYCHHGPDYWDDELCFCPKEKKSLVEKYNRQFMW